MSVETAAFAAAAVRLALPIVLAASGELVSERAGVLNLSLDGFMLSAAFTGAVVAQTTGSPVAGTLAGILAALCVAMLQAVLSVFTSANQLVTGIAINSLVLGATTFGARLVLKGGGSNLPSYGAAHLGGLADIPILGPALFRLPTFAYFGLLLAAIVLFVAGRTQTGVVLKAVGESGRVSDETGLPVRRVRVLGVLVAGLMAGVAGVELALADLRAFTDGMTSGIGYLAVIAVIAGSWRIGRVLLACLVLGAARAMEFQAQSMGIDLPVAVFHLLPYVLALIAVAGLVGRRAGPLDLTVPFERKA